MEATIKGGHTTNPIAYYWELVKDLEVNQKLELVTMLIDSIRLRQSDTKTDEQELNRGFRSLAGCWGNDEGDDDIEAIIKKGHEGRNGNRTIPPYDE